MNNTLTVKRGDIVWLKSEIPYYELGGSVQSIDRPYMVISNNINNKKCPTVNLASISKQIRKSSYPMHVFLDKNKYNLKYDSVIFAEQVITVPKNYIAEITSSLDSKDLKRLNKAIFIQLIDESCNINQVIV